MCCSTNSWTLPAQASEELQKMKAENEELKAKLAAAEKELALKSKEATDAKVCCHRGWTEGLALLLSMTHCCTCCSARELTQPAPPADGLSHVGCTI